MNTFKEELKKLKPLDDQADFVMSVVDDSREKRRDLEPIWEETELSYLVRPFNEDGSGTSDPLDMSLTSTFSSRGRRPIFLKDPETHQQMNSIIAKIVLKLFPDDRFVGAKGVGFEDIWKGLTVANLLTYVHRLPTHFLAMYEWVLGASVFGTGILEAYWLYREEMRNMRSVEMDEFGEEISTSTPFVVPVYDDVRYDTVDVRDFFNDPGAIRMCDASYAVKRFKITGLDALRKAEAGIFDKEAVEDAVERGGGDADESQDKPSEDPTMLSHRRESHADLKQMTGFEFYGETPFKTEKQDNLLEPGVKRRRITVINGITVRSRAWNRRLPFFDLRLTPRLNSFWGIAPAEIIRYDQDFADTVKSLLATAAVRLTHPPMIYNKYGDVDLPKLRRWQPDVPVGADLRQVSTPIYTVPYDPQLGPAFQVYGGNKQQMREATGDTDFNQGLGLGTKRFSATESLQTAEQAAARPEMFALVVERGPLPELGKFTLELCQEYLDTAGLRARIGDTEARANLADILADYDIEYVGSRQESRSQSLQSLREIASAAANPIVSQLIPWIPLLQKYFRRLGQDDIAAMVGNQELTTINILLNQMAAGGSASFGNGNGTTPANEPLGILPQQAAGNVG